MAHKMSNSFTFLRFVVPLLCVKVSRDTKLPASLPHPDSLLDAASDHVAADADF